MMHSAPIRLAGIGLAAALVTALCGVTAEPAHAAPATSMTLSGGSSSISPGASEVVEVRRRYRRTGRNVAIGLGVAATAAIIASQARANDKSWCERLYRSCERGNRYNCREFDRRCY